MRVEMVRGESEMKAAAEEGSISKRGGASH